MHEVMGAHATPPDALPSPPAGPSRRGRRGHRRRNNKLVKRAVIASVVFALLAAGLGFFLSGNDNSSAQPGVQSLWSAIVPANADSPDSRSVNVGLRFHSTVSGQILGVRFYKGPRNIGTHVGSLWSATGQLLESVTFTDEAPTGWQVASFAKPVDISPATTYEVSYLAPYGHYAYDDNYFKVARQSGDLIADQATPQQVNGIYTYSMKTANPATASPHTSNYWVDVLFKPSSAQSSSLAPALTASGGSPTASGTASASASASKSASASPSASKASTAPPSPHVAVPPAGNFVKPGSVGYLGATSALKVYQPGGAAPSGCSWLSYGLRCDQTNLSLDHVWIKGSFYWTGTGTLSISQSIVQGGTSDSWYAILGHPSDSGNINSTIKVTDSTVSWLPGKTMPSGEDVAPIWSAYGNQAQIAIRDDLSGMPQGIDPTANSIIQDNWIHDLLQTGTADNPTHLDGIFSQGGGNIKIEGNYVDVPVRSDTTAAIFIQDQGATDTGISITDNYLNGGAFTLRNQTGINVDVENNTFANSVWGPVGDLSGYQGTYGTWAGNVALGGAALTSP